MCLRVSVLIMNSAADIRVRRQLHFNLFYLKKKYDATKVLRNRHTNDNRHWNLWKVIESSLK